MLEPTPDSRRQIRGYHAVREAARDYERYSSDLLGDRDVRTYRQLPLESDPPRHTLFRSALQPLFMGQAIAPKRDQFEELARTLMGGISSRGGGEIATELALPYVIGCLTIIYNRPQDYDDWLSWGPDVWTAEAFAQGRVTAESQRAHRERNFDVESQRSGATLDAYLRRAFDEAEARRELELDSPDVWDHLMRLEINGERLSREELSGIANVLLAGGRDTVIKLITGLTWHLTRVPADRQFLAENHNHFNRTIAEMVRYLTPLSKMERVLQEDRTTTDGDRDPSKYVLLSFVSANFDKTIWPNPEELDIYRERHPHLAFGFGRHSCMGMNITEHEAGAFLRVLVDEWPGWVLDGEPDIEWVIEGEGDDAVTVIERFNELNVRVHSVAE